MSLTGWNRESGPIRYSKLVALQHRYGMLAALQILKLAMKMADPAWQHRYGMLAALQILKLAMGMADPASFVWRLASVPYSCQSWLARSTPYCFIGDDNLRVIRSRNISKCV